ncbi:PREDICTED: integrin beta pat-3-like [Priapulus caudatus]|uniref:Integrin beta n=1 Tax=Priapulus caudatus TaxID=37621 RepID=A0ABM1FC52_PRICU|nr:PREDICTED: integrin beta pat-3-like [Priapulus caudatus]
MESRHSYKLLLALTAMLAMAASQDVSKLCFVNSKKCGDCISAYPECVWCKQEGFDSNEGSISRCDTMARLISNNCSQENIVNPKSSETIDVQKNLTDGAVAPDEQAVQLFPQEITMNIRPNDPRTIRVQYSQAEDYPVDLYFLMDLSKSMEDDKANLAMLGDRLAAEMQNITKNFRLGFGSFVDKVALPFTSQVPSKLKEPCAGCSAPYLFKHELTLTTETDKFAKKVNEVPISGNLDAPEGGMDALVQAIMCEEQIGWRTGARHLIVYASDASFHYAGDGKLGGIVMPNDGQCHLDDNDAILQGTEQDYPSISQLKKLIGDKSINVIFAAIDSAFDVYNGLSAIIEGSTAGVLARDSSNIVGLIKDNYDQISSTVQLYECNETVSDGESSGQCGSLKNLEVRYSNEFDGEVQEGPRRAGIRVGDTVTYNIKQHAYIWGTFSIRPRNIAEKLLIKLNVICDCDCGDKIENSTACSGNGTLACGVCECNPNYTGQQCQCRLSDESNDVNDDTCKAHVIVVCTISMKDFTSKEIPDFTANITKPASYVSAEVSDATANVSKRITNIKVKDVAEVVSNVTEGVSNATNSTSVTRGQCVCGTCVCNQDYTGTRCQCPASKDTCIASNGKLCNGPGNECTCDGGRWRCKCEEDSNFRGPTCEDCPTCEGYCEQSKDCVQCVTFGTGKYDQGECDRECSTKEIIPQKTVSEDLSPQVNRKLCQYPDTSNDDGCSFRFTYEFDYVSNIILRAQTTRVCPLNLAAVTGAVTGGVIGGIILAGLLLLLLWKLLTTAHDKREYAKFENERQLAKWRREENPLYHAATTTVQNPAFGSSNIQLKCENSPPTC